jgi:hypothetical protein
MINFRRNVKQLFKELAPISVPSSCIQVPGIPIIIRIFKFGKCRVITVLGLNLHHQYWFWILFHIFIGYLISSMWTICSTIHSLVNNHLCLLFSPAYYLLFSYRVSEAPYMPCSSSVICIVSMQYSFFKCSDRPIQIYSLGFVSWFTQNTIYIFPHLALFPYQCILKMLSNQYKEYFSIYLYRCMIFHWMIIYTIAHNISSLLFLCDLHIQLSYEYLHPFIILQSYIPEFRSRIVDLKGRLMADRLKILRDYSYQFLNF